MVEAFLQHMANVSKRRNESLDIRELNARLRDAPKPKGFALAHGFGVISEFKRAAPSVGVLDLDANIETQLHRYESAGSVAVSVVTEPTVFQAQSDDLYRAVRATRLPVIRKDFLTGLNQLVEARAVGASGVLVIVKLLSDSKLRAMIEGARDLGMFALVEAFDETDIERAVNADAQIIGINSRNLNDLSVDFERFAKLRHLIPSDRVAVAESGIRTPEQLNRVQRQGFDAALIGTALMTNELEVAR